MHIVIGSESRVVPRDTDALVFPLLVGLGRLRLLARWPRCSAVCMFAGLCVQSLDCVLDRSFAHGSFSK